MVMAPFFDVQRSCNAIVVSVLQIRQSSELKRKLGITVWKEITEDVNQGIKNVKESQV